MRGEVGEVGVRCRVSWRCRVVALSWRDIGVTLLRRCRDVRGEGGEAGDAARRG